MLKLCKNYPCKHKEVKNMKIANFGVEEWLNIWENDAIYDMLGVQSLHLLWKKL